MKIIEAPFRHWFTGRKARQHLLQIIIYKPSGLSNLYPEVQKPLTEEIFSLLTLIFNSSQSTKDIPAVQIANGMMIFKEGKQNDASNSGPISLPFA